MDELGGTTQPWYPGARRDDMMGKIVAHPLERVLWRGILLANMPPKPKWGHVTHYTRHGGRQIRLRDASTLH